MRLVGREGLWLRSVDESSGRFGSGRELDVPDRVITVKRPQKMPDGGSDIILLHYFSDVQISKNWKQALTNQVLHQRSCSKTNDSFIALS